MKVGNLGIFSLVICFTVFHFVFGQSEVSVKVSIATWIGGLAYTLMSVSLFLSTRPKFVESAFGGLDRIYQAHKISGVMATLLVLIHFFLSPKEIPIEFIGSDIQLVPSAPMGMMAMIFLIISIGISLNRKIAYHKWKLPHKLMGIIFIVITLHMITTPEIFFKQNQLSGFFLLFMGGLGLSSYFYSIFGFNKSKGYAYTLKAVNDLERSTELVLSPKGEKLQFISGQFAYIEIQDPGFNEPHPFTISSSPKDDDLRFIIRASGDWTRKVREELKSGLDVVVRGAYGRFDSNKGGNKQVWLAGGVGITPFLSMLRELKKNDNREISLVYAVREKDEAVFLKELQNIAEESPNVRLVLLESNKEHYARVEMMKQKLSGNLSDYDYYLCGPKPMVNGICNDLRKEKVPQKNIHTEAFEFR